MQSKKITIRDVAKEANVSIATVSRALNNNCHVKKNTLDSIFQAIEKLGYQYYPIIHHLLILPARFLLLNQMSRLIKFSL